MAIHTLRSGHLEPYEIRPCFLCGYDIPGHVEMARECEAIVWMGADGQMIFLCIGCAQKLGVHLIQDVRSWQHGGHRPLREVRQHV